MQNNNLTQEHLKSILEYDPDTGNFTWKVNRGSNKVLGLIAGNLNKSGYVYIMIDNKDYRAHRLAWLYMTGEWPVDQIDHINMIKNDNRWENLREATNSENNMNRIIQKNNTSNYRGVYFRKDCGLWAAYIAINKKRIHLGIFSSAHIAHLAHQVAEINLFGEFSRAAS